MPQDLANLFGLSDDGKDTHRSGTTRTDQQIDLVYLGDEPCPSRSAFFVRNRIGFSFIVGLHRLEKPAVVPSSTPQGRDETTWGISGHLPLVREAYSPYRRIYCDPRGGMCCVSSRKKRITAKVLISPLKKSLSEV